MSFLGIGKEIADLWPLLLVVGFLIGGGILIRRHNKRERRMGALESEAQHNEEVAEAVDRAAHARLDPVLPSDVLDEARRRTGEST